MNWFENLKRLKIESGMSTREIAEKSGLSEPTLEKIFSGATKSPGINIVQTIVHTLGYTLDDLDDTAKPTPKDGGGLDIELVALIKRIPPERMPEVQRYLRFQAEQEGKP